LILKSQDSTINTPLFPHIKKSTSAMWNEHDLHAVTLSSHHRTRFPSIPPAPHLHSVSHHTHTTYLTRAVGHIQKKMNGCTLT